MSLNMTDDDTRTAPGQPDPNEGLIIPQVDAEGNLYVDGVRLYPLPEMLARYGIKLNTFEYYLRRPNGPRCYQTGRGRRFITEAEMERWATAIIGLRIIGGGAGESEDAK